MYGYLPHIELSNSLPRISTLGLMYSVVICDSLLCAETDSKLAGTLALGKTGLGTVRNSVFPLSIGVIVKILTADFLETTGTALRGDGITF